MRRYIYSKNNDKLLREEEAEPICGGDFCDSCGDCLVCYGEEEYSEGGWYFWVVYEGE